MLRQVCALAAAAAGLMFLSACDAVLGETYEDDAALTAGVRAVRLEGLRAGSVTVRGGAAKTSLHRRFKYRGDRPGGPTHRIAGGVLVLGGCGSECSVSYTVDVPAGLPVSGGTSSGSIQLSRVGGVDVRTHSGSIRLDHVSGAVKARTTNGRIEGSALKGGGIDASTSNGAIRLTPSAPQNVRAKTSNGRITVTVPAGSYRVAAHTTNGDAKVDVPNSASAGLLLDLTTGNGDITAKVA